ncbi:MAG: Flp pilus assembly complex ATPase component TadA, partial [Parcubacteria group bacterium]|nr:Flp pilus assembly complex ATPase component TadA [Parcubacteria group bacterium]
TGHIVLSTLHTNDAAGIIPRLRELGVQPHMLPDVLNAGIAQRLVRRLCEYCKYSYEASREEREKITHALSIISPRAHVDIPKEVPKLWRSRGCDRCFRLKYRGRAGIFEVITLTDAIRKLIAQEATAHEVLAGAIDAGMITMLQDGIFKIFEGMTDLEEVERVTGEMAYTEELYESGTTQMLMRGVRVTPEIAAVIGKDQKETRDLSRVLKILPLEKFLPVVVGYALRMRATDIHFEADRESFIVRFRIDGVLYDSAPLTKIYHQPVVSSLKILGGLDTQKHGEAQEGRFSVFAQKQTIDARLSILPGGYGETAVVRLLTLSPEIKNLHLTDLGIRDNILPRFEEVLRQPTGLILSTGPTSSGKTTTMYAILKQLNVRGVKIISVEDPIEYRLEGVIQTQVQEREGYTFASALAKILRQNPNIIMIGEVRDRDTADIAIQASNTGHLVLSTIHANTAAAAFERFSSLGIELGGVVSSLRVAIGQRLVRRVCPSCAQKKKIDHALAQELTAALKKLPASARRNYPKTTSSLLTARGCTRCHLGYRGQIGIFEFLFMSESLSKRIRSGASVEEIQLLAEKEGMLTLREDALLKAQRGVTTIEEVDRIRAT